MRNDYLSQHAYDQLSIADIGARRHIAQIEGPIHPRGPVAENLRIAAELARNLARYIEHTRADLMKMQEVA